MANNKTGGRRPMSKSAVYTELANETGMLIRQEVALAQAEMTRKVTRVGKNAGSLAAGGAIGYGAFLVLLASIVAGLSYLMPVWLAALIVALAVGATAYYMINSALDNLRKTDLAPHETVTTLKEDAKWLKRQMT